MWFMQKAGYGFDLLLDTILLGLIHKFSITIFLTKCFQLPEFYFFLYTTFLYTTFNTLYY